MFIIVNMPSSTSTGIRSSIDMKQVFNKREVDRYSGNLTIQSFLVSKNDMREHRNHKQTSSYRPVSQQNQMNNLQLENEVSTNQTRAIN